MKHHYADIRDAIQRAPLWFDEHGVPRYARFEPRLVANIYASQVALVRIHCQNCGHPFDVAFSYMAHEHVLPGGASEDLATRVRTKKIHYGDPPNIGCCPSGPTMNSDPQRVLEFWESGLTMTQPWWVRRSDLELDVRDEDATDGDA